MCRSTVLLKQVLSNRVITWPNKSISGTLDEFDTVILPDVCKRVCILILFTYNLNLNKTQQYYVFIFLYLTQFKYFICSQLNYYSDVEYSIFTGYCGKDISAVISEFQMKNHNSK